MLRQQRRHRYSLSRHHCLFGLLLLGLFLGHKPARAEQPDGEKLPVERIVLFNSGIGFFEHRGIVEGDDQVELKFKTNDINDLLKSLVLQDLGGGKISTVSYGSRDPITKTLKTFAIDLTDRPTMFDLLVQVRGRELIVHAPNEVRGVMIGAESRPVAVPGGEPIKTDYINLLTDGGLRTFALNSIERIQMADEELQKEFRTALRTLASANATDKKAVTLNFLGEGKRPVRVGYVREAPVWKTSYRLVMSEEKDPLLQGWAIVENTGDQDWQNVELSLISGRPISFMMDLYSPLHAPRPRVAHELYASLQPQEYGQAMDESKALASRPQAVRAAEQERSSRMHRRQAMGGGGGYGGGGLGGSPGYGGEFGGNSSGEEDPFSSFDIAEGVDSVAEASEVGELFRYNIDMPVSIKRQQSAMLPIVNQSVESSKISIYNREVHAKHPLNGIRLKNTSDLHLMQGPITLFDGGVYAGDGKIAALPPGEERLVSYAMDLDVEVAPSAKASSNKLTTVKIVNGALQAEQHYLRSWSYKIKNSSDKAKTVLVEHPKQDQWKLVDPDQPSETTRDRYRFEVPAKPNETSELEIRQRRIGRLVISLRNTHDSRYEFYLSAKEVSEAVKEALREYQQRRSEISELVRHQNQRQNSLAVIDKEQARIRKNMQQLPRDSELYKRYIKKFTEQEDTVERLNAEIREFEEEVAEREKQLQAQLEGLDVE